MEIGGFGFLWLCWRSVDLGRGVCGLGMWFVPIWVAIVAICSNLGLGHGGYGYDGCYNGGFVRFCSDMAICHWQWQI